MIRPARQVRRMRGKSDEIDAYAAAHVALAGNDAVTPKTAAGPVEAIRVTHAARRSTVKARTETIQQIKSPLVTAPEPIRAEYRALTAGRLVDRLAASRPRSGDDETAACTRVALKRLAVRHQQLDAEIAAHEADLTRLVRSQSCSDAGRRHRGDHRRPIAGHCRRQSRPDRLRGGVRDALRRGADPRIIGQTNRHRLNCGGDRAADCALHQIAINRLATDPVTRTYAAKRTAEGKTNKDILRCLKRAIAREVFHLITNPPPAEGSTDLRLTREHLGLSMAQVAAALDCSIAKISRLERGHISNLRFLHQYRDWLTNQKPRPNEGLTTIGASPCRHLPVSFLEKRDNPH